MIKQLPVEFVRASDPALFDPHTFQRTSASFDPINGKPLLPLDHDLSADANKRNHSIQTSELQEGVCRVTWTNGQNSVYPVTWIRLSYERWMRSQSSSSSSPAQTQITETTTTLQHTSYGQQYPHSESSSDDKSFLWRDWTPESLYEHASMDSHELLQDGTHDGMTQALRILYRYGILHVTNTPTDDQGAAVAAMGAALGGGHAKENPQTSLYTRYQEQNQGNSNHQTMNGDDPFRVQLPHGTDGPLRTLYGTVWSTTSGGQADGASVADSAYGHEGLPLHTDMTYLQNPPGLQIFTMVQPAATTNEDDSYHNGGGGASIFADGWAAAEVLRQSHPQAYQTLTTVPRRYRCVDPTTGWHLEATGPVLETSPWDPMRVTRVRHNDLDRLPDLPSSMTDCADFYQRLDDAHQAWNDILAQDSTRLVVPLKAGETVVVANQRVMHGRYAFHATPERPRAVTGCYVGQDELSSRFRMLGFNVE